MKPIRYALMAAIAATGLWTGAVQAAVLTGTFTFDVTTGNTNAGFATLPSVNPFTGPTATATFSYTGALNFDNTAAQNNGSSGDLNSSFFASAGNVGPNFGISPASYSGSGNFNTGNDHYSTLAGFLAGSGSAANFDYASIYTIDLGVLTAGTVLTITHDDGASVFQGSTQVGSTVAGPTTAVTDVVTIGTTGDTTLYYSRQNGTPSILEVSALSFTAGVPEPSTWAMMLIGFAGLGYMAFRRKSVSAVA